MVKIGQIDERHPPPGWKVKTSKPVWGVEITNQNERP